MGQNNAKTNKDTKIVKTRKIVKTINIVKTTKIVKTRKIKKYLLQGLYYKLTDSQLEIAIKLLKPEEDNSSSFLYQTPDTKIEDEYLVNRFIGLDSVYLSQYISSPITATQLKNILTNIQLEEVKRIMINQDKVCKEQVL
jgi:hypothetical protein